MVDGDNLSEKPNLDENSNQIDNSTHAPDSAMTETQAVTPNQSQEPDQIKTPVQANSFSIRAWLEEQKSIISLMVFFIAGISILYSNFVTQKEVESLACVLRYQAQYMTKTLELNESLRLNLNLNEEALILAAATPNLSDHEIKMYDHLVTLTQEAGARIIEINTESVEINTKMGEC